MLNLTFHHVGCAVESIREARECYRLMARSMGEIIPISAQGVNICFVEIAPGFHVELVESQEGESVVARLLKKQITYYHLGFLTPRFEQAIESLTAEGYHQINTFRSEAFGMRRCAFLASPAAHLIELIEAPAM